MTLPAIRTNIQDRTSLVEAMRDETYTTFLVEQTGKGDLPPGVAQAADVWMDRHLFVAVTDFRGLLPKGVEPPPAGATVAALSQGPQQWAGKSNTSEPPPAVAYYTGATDHESPLDIEAWLQTNRFIGIWALMDSCFYEFSHANRSTVIVA